ncbi:hypothetical protein QYE76_057252 [Lolium multiflorum]|uniref:Integrase catalytic domain-containing protein n=1 Tax=Lolium multiflorum TaxID=4521 RepID=A0AAD8T4W1_LOLMU|nr:hypothetical protein QYE76_057252 [Lolium multiflorum]
MKAEVLEEVKKEIKKMLDAGFIGPCRVSGSVGLFEYVVMTFGLKNADATYQRAMNYIFHDLIGKLVEIYIDDVVVKSVATDGHLEDLRQVLDRTRKFGLRMNPKKCAFGVTAGQFLGFLVHERGIEIGLSPEAVRTMKPPTTKKELQCLIGKINFVEAHEEYKCESESLFPLWVQCRELAQFRFGIPQTITTDGGSVFVSKEMKKFCDDMGIKLIRSSPYYAQANGQAQASNKSLIKLIKRKIDEHPRHEVLSEALWAYRMSCHGEIKTTPYQLVYGQEAVLPWEVKAGSRRVTFQNDLTAEEYAALMSDSIEDATELRLWSLEKIKENKAKVTPSQERSSSSLSSSDSPMARKRRSLSPSVKDRSSSDQTEESWLDSLMTHKYRGSMTRCSGGDGGVDGGDDDDDDGDDVPLDDDGDGVDFPLRREFPRSCRRALSLVFSARGGCNPP